jgi:two-component system, OmpR family, sensor histidine kinase MtrB
VVNERLVQQPVQESDQGSLADRLTGLAAGQDTTVALRHQGGWITSGRTVDLAGIPSGLISQARSGQPARERTEVGGIPVVMVALPMQNRDDVSVQLFPLVEQASNLRFLSWVLFAGVVVSTIAAPQPSRRRPTKPALLTPAAFAGLSGPNWGSDKP